jgi:metal iron transporter
LFFRSDHGRQGMVFFEIVIVTLVSCRPHVVGDEADVQVLCVFVCFMVLLHLIKPVWKDVFFGLVPSKVSFSVHLTRGCS